MSRGGMNFRGFRKTLQAKRDAALLRPELSSPQKPQPVAPDLVAAAIAAGRFTKIPAKRRRR